MFRSSNSLIAVLVLFSSISVLDAQEVNEATVLKGTVDEIKKKGRSTILSVKYDNGLTKDIAVTPKINLMITGKGTDEMLKAKQFVSTVATKSNDMFFTKEIVLHMTTGRKPKSTFAPAPKKVGRSVNSFTISGSVISFGDDADFKDYKALSVKVGSKTGKILIEKGYKITVASNDTSLIKKGAKIEVEGKPGRGGRFTISKTTIPLNKEFKPEDFEKKRR